MFGALAPRIPSQIQGNCNEHKDGKADLIKNKADFLGTSFQ